MIDFGLTRQYHQTRQNAQEKHYHGGTRFYESPEKANCDKNGPYNPYLADAYAFGVTLGSAMFHEAVFREWSCLSILHAFDMLLWSLPDSREDRITYHMYVITIRELFMQVSDRIHVKAALAGTLNTSHRTFDWLFFKLFFIYIDYYFIRFLYMHLY